MSYYQFDDLYCHHCDSKTYINHRPYRVNGDKMVWFDAFVSSVTLYSLLRTFDVWSTKLCLARLNPEMHEVNPVVVPLIRKMGFNKTMLVTWIPLAIAIGFVDALYAYPLIGIPALWLVFGLFHLIAAANNIQLYYQTKIFGVEVIEENTKRIIRMLKTMSTFSKITFLLKTNILNLFFTIYGIVALILFSILLSSLNIYPIAPIPILLVVGPPIMVLDLIMFFPVMIFGSLIISLRRLRMNSEHILDQESRNFIILSVEFVEAILYEAREKGANCIQLPLLERYIRRGGETGGT